MENVPPPFTKDVPLINLHNGFTSKMKRAIYALRGRVDEINGQKYKKGLSHMHHMFPKSEGGPEIRRNAMVLGYDTHELLHDYCWNLTKKELPGEPTTSREFRQRWAHNVYWISYDLREATRASMIAEGYDPRYVYQEDYKYDAEVKRRIDMILNNTES